MEIKLRKWTMNDLDSLVKYANNPNIAKNLTNAFPSPYSVEDGRFFIEKANSDSPAKVLAISLNDEAIGAIGVFPQSDIFCKNAEMGYWLAEIYWGKGIVPKAISLMVDYAFQTFDIERIFARPFGTNLASQRVLEKSGFKLEGQFEKTIFKNGEYIDELIYAIRKFSPTPINRMQ
jgi:[ribosomal protein S5]-alanine N-acetyltransferase